MENEIRDREFRREDIELDGKTFIKCKFTQCDLIYSGGDVPSLIGCQFNATNFRFKESAERTIQLLALFHQGGLASVVEATFNNIRSQKFEDES